MGKGTKYKHKRQRISGSKLLRRRPTRNPYDKVLIVCEGKKTEPHYFKGLKNHLRLSSVKIVGEGAGPEKIVDRAMELFREEEETGDSFDKIYCVFDRNGHDDYKEALNTLRSSGWSEGGITSVPCFEYWFLLHYTYTTKLYQQTKGKSAGERVLSDLKKYLPNYDKKDKDIFENLRDKLETAKKNARRSLEAAEEAGTNNPSTRVHELVDFLQKIKK